MRQQRLRWLRGMAALPARVQGALIFFQSYWLAVPGLLLASRPGWALVDVAAKVALLTLTSRAAARSAGLPPPRWWVVLAFEGYALALLTDPTLRRLLGPRRVVWKGRVYG